VEDLDEDVFAEGLGFDGSSIRGFQQINESDMLLFPDPGTAYVDPCLEIPTLSMICDVKDPVSGKPYSRDPRYIVQKAEAYLKSTGIAEASYWDRSWSSISSTTCSTTRTPSPATIASIRMKGYGTAGGMRARTWDSSCVTKRATSRFRRRTSNRTCAPRSF